MTTLTSALPAALRPAARGQAVQGTTPAARSGAYADAHTDELLRSIYVRAGMVSPGTIAVTSALVGEGKTSLAAGLAAVVASDFPTRRIALVETDFGRPTMATQLGLVPNPGLLDSLVRSSGAVENAYRESALPNLTLVPAGGPDIQPTRWFCAREIGEVIARIRRDHDLVLLDLPALSAQSGVPALLDEADGVVFVVRVGATPTRLVRRALADLSPGKLRGVVLNDAHTVIPSFVRRLVGLE